MQLYIVVALGFFVTFIFYPFVKKQIRKESGIYYSFRRIAKHTHAERKGFWLFAQEWADKSTSEEVRNL